MINDYFVCFCKYKHFIRLYNLIRDLIYRSPLKKKSGVLFPISPFFISKNSIEVSFRNLRAAHPCLNPSERARTCPKHARTQPTKPTEPTGRPAPPGNKQPHPEPTSRTGSPRSESNPPHRNRPRPPQPGTIYPARNRALPAPESARPDRPLPGQSPRYRRFSSSRSRSLLRSRPAGAPKR